MLLYVTITSTKTNVGL